MSNTSDITFLISSSVNPVFSLIRNRAAAYEVRDAEQKATILAIQTQMETNQAALQGLQIENQRYEAEMSEYLDIFRRHNLAKLASAKPGMIEKRVNDKTKEVFDAIEADSNRISGLND